MLDIPNTATVCPTCQCCHLPIITITCQPATCAVLQPSAPAVCHVTITCHLSTSHPTQQQPAPYRQPTSVTSQPTITQPQADVHAQPQSQSQSQPQHLSTDLIQSQQYVTSQTQHLSNNPIQSQQYYVASQTQPNGTSYPQQAPEALNSRVL